MLFVQAVIDRFENNQAVLLFPDGQELIVEKKYLPKKSAAGMWLKINFEINKALTKKKRTQAKKLLSKLF